jgi:LysR family glycine cleavage system transcriptional activator
VKLTPDGAEYARAVRQSIRRLRLATNDIKARGSKGSTLAVVRIETPPTFANCWLLPRLPTLIAQHPGIELRVNAQGPHLQGDRLPWIPAADAPADIQIVYGGDDLWEDRASRLSSEFFQPYCAPSLRNRQALQSPHHLLQHTLISSAQNHVSWDDWMEAQGVDIYENAVATMQLDPSHLAIEAAVEGMGVILENRILVERHLSNGSLIAPFTELGAPGLSYWILTLSSRQNRPAVDAVIGWLKQNASI